MKTLFLGFLGLDLVLNQASAQYLTHHQQHFFDIDDVERQVFETKALAPVPSKTKKKLFWAFASNVGPNVDGNIATLLVKLKGNKPNASPFEFLWAKEYSNRKKGLSLEVEDVNYETKGKKKNYILCGSIKKGNKSQGFMLRVNASGSIVMAKRYKEIYNLKSCIPNQNGNGYVAVGQTQPRKDGSKDAVYVNVKKNLKTICGLNMTGIFPEQDFFELQLESGFNKVIPYSRDGSKLYAAVGETASNSFSDCENNSDVLVALVDEGCELRWVNRYGNQGEPDLKRTITERGLSIAQFDTSDGGLVITGKTTAIYGCDITVFDNILIFKLQEDGSVVNWMGHYSVEFDVSNCGL